ncbi:hypothetical protein CCP3SC1AL1_200015 [Gammaproteobacteria bacterium]
MLPEYATSNSISMREKPRLSGRGGCQVTLSAGRRTNSRTEVVDLFARKL